MNELCLCLYLFSLSDTVGIGVSLEINEYKLEQKFNNINWMLFKSLITKCSLCTLLLMDLPKYEEVAPLENASDELCIAPSQCFNF